MTVYALALLSIADRERYRRYAGRFAAALDGFDGRLLAADEAPTVLEGDWDRDKVVLVAFSGREEFERWSTSAAYRAIAGDRTASTDGTVLLLAGLTPWTGGGD